MWMNNLEPYELCVVAGIVRRLRIDPIAGVIEICVADRNGWVAAFWDITRPTPQLALAPGTDVVLEGMTVVDAAGRVSLREPTFQVFRFAGVN